MNNLSVTGRVCNVPKIRILQIEDKTINICNFTIAVSDGISEEGYQDKKNMDFFECICFNDAALAFNANFIKGSKISCTGKVKNHYFEDANRTKHFTQILVLSQIEFGDTLSVLSRGSKRKAVDMSITSDYNNIKALYDLICDNGYLCIDEDDYYKIATDNVML